MSQICDMRDTKQSRGSDAATLEAFYSRVIHRVCSSYQEESELSAQEAIARLQQKWQENLTLYTGKQGVSDAAIEQDKNVSMIVSVSSSSDESSLSSSMRSSSVSFAASKQAIGRPSAHLPSVATSTSSIFVRMLGGKRKLDQLDGSASDVEDNVKWREVADQEQEQELQQQSIETFGTSSISFKGKGKISDDDEEEEKEEEEEEEKEEKTGEENDQRTTREEEEEGGGADDGQSVERPRSSSTTSTLSSSLLVCADDLAPVSGLSGINLPIQLAAEYSKFGHRGKRRGFIGQLHAILLTWPSRIEAQETLHPGDLVWCYPDSTTGIIHEGELMKVVSLGDTRHELKVKRSNGKETIVSMERVRRLSEYLVRHGSVHFSTEH